MGAVDLVERAKEELERWGFANVKLRPLTSSEEGVYVRRDPSTVTRTYMDGTQEVQFILAVYARFGLEDQAIATCDLASQVLRHADLSSANGSYEITAISEYSGVTAAETPTGPLSTYVVGIRIDITTN